MTTFASPSSWPPASRSALSADVPPPGGGAGSPTNRPKEGPGRKPAAGLQTSAALRTSIKILVVDDHPIVRKGLVALLGAVDRMVVVGEAADGAEAIDKARALRPDIVLMDYDMPGMNGMAATGILRRELPECKVIILSMHREADEVLQLLDSGARGYVLKEAPAEELLRAVEIVNAGQPFFSPEVASVALNSFIRSGDARKKDPLTAREREVLVHIAEGLSNKEIATRLQVGVRTVETHRERIMRKLDIHSIAGLTRYALAKGLISLQK